MYIDCGRCTPRTKRQYPDTEFRVVRRPKYVLWTGHRVKFAYHERCGEQTILLDSSAIGERRMAHESVAG